MERNKRYKVLSILSLLAGVIISINSIAFAVRLPKLFSFKEKDALKEWSEKVFKNKVIYSVKIEKVDGYLAASSNNSASGIFYRLKFSPKEKPMVSWKWKVLKFPDKNKKTGGSAKSGWIEKDDYAARFYVIFPKAAFNLTKTLEYVWDKDLPEGTIMTSPYFKNIKIIVAESADKKREDWVYEERNVYEDFKKCFGAEPGQVGAIAIMTDTDNTASTAEAYYDEIKAGYKNVAE